MAEFAFEKGWKTAGDRQRQGARLLQERHGGVREALHGARRQDRARHRTSTAPTRCRRPSAGWTERGAEVIVTSTAFGDSPRSSRASAPRQQTPIMNSWAGDGTNWVPKNPKVTKYYVTFASVFGDDPNHDVRKLFNQLKPARLRPRPGVSSPGRPRLTRRDAVERSNGSTEGPVLAQSSSSSRAGRRSPGRSASRGSSTRVRPSVSSDRGRGQQGRVPRGRHAGKVVQAQARSRRGTRRQDRGPETRSGPPPSRGSFAGVRRSRRSRSSFTGTRSWG